MAFGKLQASYKLSSQSYMDIFLSRFYSPFKMTIWSRILFRYHSMLSHTFIIHDSSDDTLHPEPQIYDHFDSARHPHGRPLAGFWPSCRLSGSVAKPAGWFFSSSQRPILEIDPQPGWFNFTRSAARRGQDAGCRLEGWRRYSSVASGFYLDASKKIIPEGWLTSWST